MLRTSSVSKVLPRSGKVRALIGGVGAVGMTVVAVALSTMAGAVAPAAAYDCQRNPICEYLKIEKVSGAYDYDAEMQLYSAKDPGRILYSWSEKNPKFTLWHWNSNDTGHERDLKIHLTVKAHSNNYGDLGDLDEVFSAYQSWCIKIDEGGAYQSAGCSDYEDARRNMG